MTTSKVYTRAAVCLGLLAGASALASEEVVGRLAEWRLAATLAAAQGVTAGRITRDAGTGRLVLQDLRFAKNGWRVSIGRLAMADAAPGFALAGPAAAQAASAVADDIRIAGGRNVYRVPHVELRGTMLTPADVAGLVDTSTPTTLPERLARFSAAVVTAPVVVVEVGGASAARPEAAVTAYDVTLTDVVGGRIGSLTARRIEAAEPDAKGGSRMETGRVRADVLDLPLAVALANGGRADPRAALEEVFAGASVESITLHQGAEGGLTVGALRSGAFRARPLPDTLGETVALARRPLDGLAPSERRSLVDGVADALGSYELDHVEVDDLAFADGTADHRSFTLGRLALDGVGGRRSLSMVLDAVALDSPEAGLSLAHFTIRGIDQAGAVSLVRRAVAVPATSQAAIDTKASPSRASAALDSLTITVPAPGRDGNAPDGARNVVDIPEVSLNGGSTPIDGAMTSAAHMRVVYALPHATADANLKGLADLGITRLDVSTDYDVAFDPAGKRLTIGSMALRAEDLGSVAFGAVLGNVAPDAAEATASAEARARAAGAVSIESLSMRIVNAGLVEKVLPSLAASANASVSLFKAELKTQAEISIGRVLGDTPTAARLTRAISTFIDDPRSLSVSVKAPAGTTLDAVRTSGDPAALLSGMDIQATANR